MAFVIGIDPGLANAGVVVVRLHRAKETVERAVCLRTRPSAKKLKVRSADDVTRRLAELGEAFKALLDEVDPVAVCAESYSYPQHVSSAIKLGMAWGTFMGVIAGRRLPVLLATPQEAKMCVTGSRSASKDEVKTALVARYGNGLQTALATMAKGHREHPVDALAAVVACLDSPAVAVARRLR